jgi:hypothetical protein
VPMDSYLMDVNSGQSLYRPVYVLIAVLRDGRAAQRAQAALQQAMLRLYCHDLVYDHASRNSTALTVDALRQIGWNIPSRRGGSFLKGAAAFAYASLQERSIKKGKQTFAYFTQERTRVFPRAAFAVAGQDLLQLASGDIGGRQRELTSYERMLQADVDAVLFVRLAQIPSSRPSGTYPVGSPEEYRERVPPRRTQWNTAAQPPRPFPAPLKQTCQENVRGQRSP